MNKNDFLDSIGGFNLEMRDFLARAALTSLNNLSDKYKFTKKLNTKIYDENFGNFIVLFVLSDNMRGLQHFRLIPEIQWAKMHGYSLEYLHDDLKEGLIKTDDFVTMYKKVWKREDGSFKSMTEISVALANEHRQWMTTSA